MLRQLRAFRIGHNTVRFQSPIKSEFVPLTFNVEWLTVDEVADIMQINHKTVRALIYRPYQKLRALKLDRLLRINTNDLNVFLKDCYC